MDKNPKMKGTELLDCIPQTGQCPIGCAECFYNSDGWFRTKDLPLIPLEDDPALAGKVVRMNSGHDSNIERERVIEQAIKYPNFFFNTSVPKFDFPGPVVFTCNGKPAVGERAPADSKAILTEEVENLMFVRFRMNTWNKKLADSVVHWYTTRGIPVVITFMRYLNLDSIPVEERENYEWKKHVTNDYHSLKQKARDEIMARWASNVLVYSCGMSDSSFCKDCGNCFYLYWRWKKFRAEINYWRSRRETDTFHEFSRAMKVKFDGALYKDKYRSPEPWADFHESMLADRLKEEFDEWLKSRETEELVDIANLCLFIWKKRGGR